MVVREGGWSHWQEDDDLDDAELAEGALSTDSSSSLLPPAATPRRRVQAASKRSVRLLRSLAVGACATLFAGALLVSAGTGGPLGSGSSLIGLNEECDPEKEESHMGSCYAKCSDLSGGQYQTRAGPATCCRGTGASCLWIGNLKTLGSFNTRATTSNDTGCSDWEETHAGMCYTKCENLTNGTHPNRITAVTCCAGHGLTCMNPAKLRTNMTFAAGGDRQVVGGACSEEEESHYGLCYKKCSNLTDGQYNNRVAAETCCSAKGMSCLNPMYLKTDPAFGEGGGRPKLAPSCKSYEEHHGGLCYISCKRLTNGTYPNRFAPTTCCKGNGTACLNPANLATKPWFAAGGGRWAPKQQDNLTCDELEEVHVGMCYTKCAVLTENAYPHRIAAGTCCNTHSWTACLNPANTKTSPAYTAGGGRANAATCKKYEELFGGMCYVKCSIFTNMSHPFRVTGMSCCKFAGLKCLYNPSAIKTRSWFAAGGGRFATKPPENSSLCNNPETEEHAGMCFKKCSILTNNEFPYRVTVATCCKEKGLKCLEPSYRKTDSSYAQRMDGDANATNEEDPAAQGGQEEENPLAETTENESTTGTPLTVEDFVNASQVSGGGLNESVQQLSMSSANGGHAEPAEPTGEELQIWQKAVANISSFDNVSLASLGDPVSVVAEVVNGMNYNYTFSDGTVVSLFEQSWTNTLDIKSIEQPNSKDDTTASTAGNSSGPGSTSMKQGGWSAPSKPTQEELGVWENTVDTVGSYQNVELASLGQPEMVQTQVVSGTNYRFIFADGTVVTVFSQTWTNTLEVTSIEQPETTSLEGAAGSAASGSEASSSAAPPGDDADDSASTTSEASKGEDGVGSSNASSAVARMTPDWTLAAPGSAGYNKDARVIESLSN